MCFSQMTAQTNRHESSSLSNVLLFQTNILAKCYVSYSDVVRVYRANETFRHFFLNHYFTCVSMNIDVVFANDSANELS